jgi:hypothetical protein
LLVVDLADLLIADCPLSVVVVTVTVTFGPFGGGSVFGFKLHPDCDLSPAASWKRLRLLPSRMPIAISHREFRIALTTEPLMVAHVARHEMKTRPTLPGRIFFGAQDIIFCATRTAGMNHRVRCPAVVLPKQFLNVISSTHLAQGLKQHPSLVSVKLAR